MPVRRESPDVIEDAKVIQENTNEEPKPKKGKVKSKDIVVEEGKAGVTYSVGITKNIGSYESIKILASITIPLGASDETLAELDDLVVVARDKVVKRISVDLTDITAAFSK